MKILKWLRKDLDGIISGLEVLIFVIVFILLICLTASLVITFLCSGYIFYITTPEFIGKVIITILIQIIFLYGVLYVIRGGDFLMESLNHWEWLDRKWYAPIDSELDRKDFKNEKRKEYMG